MPMKIQIPGKIVALSTGFALIFLGFNGAQQYVTSFFTSKGTPEIGFESLLLVYLFFILANPIAAWAVGKYGQKRTMVAGSVSYILYIAALALNQTTLLYGASVLLGIGAALLWTGQSSYLLRASKEGTTGKNSGFFQTIFFIGSAVGIVGLGLALLRLAPQTAFLLISIAPIAGMLILMVLPSLPKDGTKNQIALVGKAASSITIVRFASVWFVISLVSGSVIGILPIQIKETMGLEYVGILTSLFYIFPIVFAWVVGTASDRYGRNLILAATYALIAGGFILLLMPNAQTLVIGTILLATAYAFTYPILPALAGDLGTKQNLESLIAVVWMAQNVGVTLSLFLGRIVTNRPMIYGISLALTLVSFAVVAPLLRKNRETLRAKIASEMQT